MLRGEAKRAYNRALLCDACNKGLGHFRDNPELLEVAAGYLRKYQLTEEMKVQ